jgi:hypothetical protein
MERKVANTVEITLQKALFFVQYAYGALFLRFIVHRGNP